MKPEYNFNEITEEQLLQKYKWNCHEIENKKNKISSNKLLNNVCFWIDLLAGTCFGIMGIYFLFKDLTLISNILGLGFMVLHGYCCIGFYIHSEDEQKEWENKILELENENKIIQKKLEMLKEVTDNGIT